MSSDSTNTYESKTEGQESQASFVKMWLDELARADSEEEEWRKGASETSALFRGKRKDTTKNRAFNIFHANIETLCPALYNSAPVPDVRRRYGDADPPGKVAAQLTERSLSFAIDCYDFNDTMKRVVRDGEIVGRGQARVRYVPTFKQVMEAGEPVVDKETQKAVEEVAYEEVRCCYVPWKYVRRGPGTTYEDVPYWAFEDFLTRDELRKLCGDLKDSSGNLVSEMVPLNYTCDPKDGSYNKTEGKEASIFRRGAVWQIWDKETRRVISICPEYPEMPLKVIPDPLELEQFFPVPRPYQPILATDSLEPVIPYEIYQDLVAELNKITNRINKLVAQCRPRAGYAGDAGDIKAVSEADDGEIVPLGRVDLMNTPGGLEKALAWFPLDATVAALKVLIEQRNEIKQIIYEVTGIADILRGSTNPDETATAQNLKAQWGSLRVQDRQAEVARFARDLMRLKAEIIANKFSWETITAQAGIRVATNEEREAARGMLAQLQQAQLASAQPPQPQQVPPDAQPMSPQAPPQGMPPQPPPMAPPGLPPQPMMQ